MGVDTERREERVACHGVRAARLDGCLATQGDSACAIVMTVEEWTGEHQIDSTYVLCFRIREVGCIRCARGAVEETRFHFHIKYENVNGANVSTGGGRERGCPVAAQ